MGRAMLIICAGVLVSLGIVSISTSNQGKSLTQNTVDYAEYTMAKNAAHTAIQMATQEINKDEDGDWPNQYYDEDNYWPRTIQGLEVRLHTDFEENDFWETGEQDKLWFYSRAQLGAEFGNQYVEVRSHYKKRPFYELVPDFEGALTFAADPDKYTFSAGGSASISGNSPTACHDEEDTSKPGIAIQPGAEENVSELDDIEVDADPKYEVKENLDYQPTDELIERLLNTPGTKKLDGNVNEPLGSATNPGVFFVEDYLKLNGKQEEGFGILVIRSDAEMEYEGDDGATLDMNGNFEWNGLIIFEDAYNFKGNGTPKVNGSILVGHTEDYDGEPIDIDISGNIHFQYDCMGEMYAKMAADQAVQQNKYTLLTSTENIKYN
ncbi:MAG: hypothetical protein WEA58_14280 [Balneolaceae bacterium]